MLISVYTTCDSISNELGFFRRAGGRIENFAYDIVQVNYNIFSIDSACIATMAAPLFVAANFVDDNVHSLFYDKEFHRNTHAWHHGVSNGIEKAAFGIIALLSSGAFYFPDAELRTVSSIFALGAISGLLVKKALKLVHVKGSVRPASERFDVNKKYYNGWPSGHMFEAAYAATVFGGHYGLRALVPLSLFAGAMFAVSLTDNRHYVSQLVAGTALGVMYGVAAHSLIDYKLCQNYSCVVNYDQQSGIGCGIQVVF